MLKYQVLEDDGHCIHLVVLENDIAIYAHFDYEEIPDGPNQLLVDRAAVTRCETLDDLKHRIPHGSEIHHITYLGLVLDSGGEFEYPDDTAEFSIIDDNGKLYPERMHALGFSFYAEEKDVIDYRVKHGM